MDSNIPTEKTEQAHPAEKVAASKHPKLIVAAFVITVLAWVTLPLQYVLSLCLCVVGLAFAVVGIRHSHGGMRNLALFTLVASGVLLLVYAVFWGALLYVTLSY
jgi:hypothetical protein